MLKELHNLCRIQLELSPIGPILIKSGEASGMGADMSFVTTYRNGAAQVFLPGTSLKGVFRAHAERIGRTLAAEKICNPFNTKYGKRNASDHGVPSCSNVLSFVEKERDKGRSSLPAPEAYKASCPACRLFGSLAFGGRFNLGDAYVVPGQEPSIEYRDGVGIDRFSGGPVHGAKFQFEVVTGGRFACELTVQNFELWQLSWIFHVLQDFEDGLVPIGLGSSRGLGSISAQIKTVELDVLGKVATGVIPPLSSAYGDPESYGLAMEPKLTLEQVPKSLGLRQRYVFDEAELVGLRQQLAPHFANFMDGFKDMEQWRKDMEQWRKQNEVSNARR